MAKENKVDGRAKSSPENGKRGGAPPGLVVEILPDGDWSMWFTRRGFRVGVETKPESIGFGWYAVEFPPESRRWVVKVPEGAKPGKRFKGRAVPKGADPRKHALTLERKSRGGSLGKFPSMIEVDTVDGKGYLLQPFPHVGELRLAMAQYWGPNGPGRREWRKLGWTLEKEKEHKERMPELMEIADAVELAAGFEWGEVARNWVRRGRHIPHLWGEGLRAWVAERKRREKIGGFEV